MMNEKLECLLQIGNFFFADGNVAAKCAQEGEGLAEEGLVLNFLVVFTICTDFSDALFLKQR